MCNSSSSFFWARFLPLLDPFISSFPVTYKVPAKFVSNVSKGRIMDSLDEGVSRPQDGEKGSDSSSIPQRVAASQVCLPYNYFISCTSCRLIDVITFYVFLCCSSLDFQSLFIFFFHLFLSLTFHTNTLFALSSFFPMRSRFRHSLKRSSKSSRVTHRIKTRSHNCRRVRKNHHRRRSRIMSVGKLCGQCGMGNGKPIAFLLLFSLHSLCSCSSYMISIID